MLTDERNIYVITENGSSVTMGVVTDANAPGGTSTPGNPLFVASFGNRFVVSLKGTPNYYLSTINLSGSVSTYFTINGVPLFNRASGVVGQFGVLHNQLYIFCDFTTDVWSNIPTQITVAGATSEFPWKLNTSYNFDYGIEDPYSLAIDFGRMCWLAQNSAGLVSFMVSDGGAPVDFSTQAINVLLENSAQTASDSISPFIDNNAIAFIYQYENTIFYRVSAGPYINYGQLDVTTEANCIEFNFDTKTWHRCIELNGERNRISRHAYFNNAHLVTVVDDPAVYFMAGNLYYNELINPKQSDHQAPDAFLKYPMRYELITPHIFNPEDYSEFITKYIEIDFVFGDKTFYKSTSPFQNTVYLITEDSTNDNNIYITTEDSTDDSPIFVIAEDGNTPTFDDSYYYALFKPHIELYYSNDGGVTFLSADLRQFSQLGQYRWRMRWYELGVSRNRCYKLVCVSSAPIVILGAVQMRMRSSGGAN
jgi:hypothetical protein